MIRREFLKVLGGLPFLGFLKEKKPDGLTLTQLMETKRQIDSDWRTFTESQTWVKNTMYFIVKDQTIFYKDKLEG